MQGLGKLSVLFKAQLVNKHFRKCDTDINECLCEKSTKSRNTFVCLGVIFSNRVEMLLNLAWNVPKNTGVFDNLGLKGKGICMYWVFFFKCNAYLYSHMWKIQLNTESTCWARTSNPSTFSEVTVGTGHSIHKRTPTHRNLRNISCIVSQIIMLIGERLSKPY